MPATVIWLGYHQFQDGLFTWLTGFVLGELALLTQPNRLGDGPPNVGLQFSLGDRAVAVGYTLSW